MPRCNPLHSKLRIALGVGLIVLALLPPVSSWLETSMTRHLLAQYPLLAGGGALLGSALARRYHTHSWTAAAALLGGLLALSFWQIPRWVDAALASTMVDIVKAGSLILLAGLPLGWGWTLAGPVLRGVVWTHAAMMAAVMGWLQLAIPLRLCNAYLITDQEQCGKGYIAIAILMIAGGFIHVMRGNGGKPPPCPADN